jgi:hypothetical protein
MRQLKYELTSGYMVGLRVEYPVIRTVEGKVVGMCLDADSPYLHAMVAAPEMLEALKEANIATMLYDGHEGRYAKIIAKAEGRVQE